MKEITVFGRNYRVVARESEEESAELRDGLLLLETGGKSEDFIMKEFLSGLLYRQLVEIFEGLKRKGGIEIYGNIDFEVVDMIDRNPKRVAKLKGNKIFVKINVVFLPLRVVEYIVAHEMAHLFVKRHTKRFWKIVERLHPDYETSHNLLVQNLPLIEKPLF
jgi:hypothetical protein